MKQFKVDMSAFYGYACGCGSYGSEEQTRVDVPDDVAAILEELWEDTGELNQDELLAATETHPELQPLYDTIRGRYADMVARYWLFEADNECLDESLEPAFWQDIEDKLYAPEVALDDFVIGFEEYDRYVEYVFADEDDRRTRYYDAYRDDYLEWVKSHTDDYPFIAERIGLDLNAVYDDMPELKFTIW